MPDREKVISNLEELLKCSRYNDNVGWNPDNDTETLEDALALLKAQEPVEPVRSKRGIYHCGSCGETCVGYEVEFTHSIIKVENYCHKCGRKVKWE